MKTSAVLLAGFSSFAAAQYGQSSGSNESTSACPQSGGAHIIVARASLEAPGYGVIGSVKDAVLTRVPGSTAEAVGYPATLQDYLNSETAGVVAMRELVNAFVAKCSGTPLVLMGYSQGAQVAADTLLGQEDRNFPDNATNGLDQPLPTSTFARTAALIIMGDPTFNTSEDALGIHVGNASLNSDFPRYDVSNWQIAGLNKRTQSYCDAGDPYCAGGNFSTISVHLGYVNEYGSQAADFVVNQIKSWYGNSTSTGSSNSTSTVPKSSASSRLPKPSSASSGMPKSSSYPSGSSNVTKTASTTSAATSTGTSTTKPSGPAYTGGASTVSCLSVAAFMGGVFALFL